MKDENIKERFCSLEELKRTIDCYDGYSDNEEVYYFIGALRFAYDYITNLQTIEQQYSAILSENAELENKITNLQEENQRLKDIRKQAINYNKVLCKIYDCGIELSNAETNLCILKDEETINTFKKRVMNSDT